MSVTRSGVQYTEQIMVRINGEITVMKTNLTNCSIVIN